MAEIRSTFIYDGDFSSVQSGIKTLTAQVNLLNRSFNSLDLNARKVQSDLARSFAANVGAIGGFKTAMVDVATATERFGNALQKQKLTLREYARESVNAFRKASNARKLAEEQVKRMQSTLVPVGGGKGMLVTPLTLDTKDFTTKLAVARQQYAIFNKLVSDGTTQLINFGKNTQWAGRQLTVGLTVPITIFGSTLSKTFREVDAELTRFAKVYGSDLVNNNKYATDQMRGQVLQLAQTIAKEYGIAAKETAALAADLAATGLEGQALMDSVAETTRLAVLGEVDKQEAMKATLALQTAFNLNTQELAQSIDFLNAVENQTSTTLTDLVEAIPKAGPVVKGLGGDIKTLSVLLTAMREGGIPAAEAANAIKSGLASLINPTRAANEQLANFGVDLQGIVERNKGQLLPTILEFKTALDTLDEFSKAQAIETVFGKYQFARMGALFDNIGESGSQTVKVMELMGASTADLARIAESEVSAVTNSTSAKFNRAVESIKASLIPVGEALTNAVIPFLTKLSDLIAQITEKFDKLPGPIQNIIKALGVISVVAGPVIMLVGLFANFVGYATKGAMGIVNLTRRMMGLPVDQFQQLTNDQLAANIATDTLTGSFASQRSAVMSLNAALEDYIISLRQVQANQPNLAVAGKGRPPIRKQKGGSIPGYGGGDTVPALLEKGEFVVNKAAARFFRPQLEAMNARKMQDGGGTEGLTAAQKEYMQDLKDNPYSRSHLTPFETEDGFKVFGGTTAASTGPYNSALNNITQILKDPDSENSKTLKQAANIVAGKTGVSAEFLLSGREPGNLQEANAQRAFLSHPLVATMKTKKGEQAIKGRRAAVGFLRSYTGGIKGTPDEKEAIFRQRLAERMALSSASLYRDATPEQIKAIYDAEKRRILPILERTHGDPDERGKQLRDSAKVTYYGNTVGGKLLSTPLLYKGKSRGDSAGSARSMERTMREVGGTSFKFQGVGMGFKSQTGVPVTVAEKRPEVVTNKPKEGTSKTITTQSGRVFIGPIGKRPGLEEEGVVNPDGSVERLTKKERMARVGASAGNYGMTASLLLNTMSAMSGQMSKTTENLIKFTTAIGVAGMAMQAASGVGGMFGKSGKLFGAGQKVGLQGALLKGGAKTAVGRGAGAAMMGAGRALSFLGGPAGIAVGLGITAAIFALNKYKQSLEEARQRSVAAFAQSAKAAEYFGVKLKEATFVRPQESKLFADNAEREAMLKIANEDYKVLVNKLKTQNNADAISELQLTYASLISQGFDQDQAQKIIKGIADAANKENIVIDVIANVKDIKTPKDALNAVGNQAVRTLQAGGVENQGAFAAAATMSIAKNYQAAPLEALGQIKDIVAEIDSTEFSGFRTGLYDSLKESQPELAEFIKGLNNSEQAGNALLLALTGLDYTLASGATSARDLAGALAQAEARTSAASVIDEEIKKEQERFKVIEKGYNDAIDARQYELDHLQENTEKKIKALEKENRALQKKQNNIRKTTDAYLKALEEQTSADKFYQDQAKSGIGAAAALASGDVVGFLQGRADMAQQGAEFSKEQSITAIKDRSDAEIQLLQDRIDANEESIRKAREYAEIREATLKKEITAQRKALGAEREANSARIDALTTLKNTDVTLNNVTSTLEKLKGKAKMGSDEIQRIATSLSSAYGNAYGNAIKQAEVSMNLPAGSLSDLIKNEVSRRMSTPTYPTPSNVSGGNGGKGGDASSGMSGAGLGSVASTGAMTDLPLADILRSVGSTFGGMPSGGDYRNPLSGSQYRISSNPGERINPITGRREVHKGIDLAAAQGTPIGAFKKGTVKFAGLDPAEVMGNKVVLDHGNGMTSVYGHMLPKLGVQNGQQVDAGAILGRVGSTGRSTGPHLHFGVLKDGESLDPRQFVSLRKGGIIAKDGTMAKLHKGEMVMPKPIAENMFRQSSPRFNPAVPTAPRMSPSSTQSRQTNVGPTTAYISFNGNMKDPVAAANAVYGKMMSMNNRRPK